MIVLVTGGRAYRDAGTVARTLSAIPVTRLVHGGASGADHLAAAWAQANAIAATACPARWRDRDGTYDPSAGFKRNAEMLAQERPALVVAFPGGKGTADMVARARRAGVAVLEVQPPGAWDDVLG